MDRARFTLAASLGHRPSIELLGGEVAIPALELFELTPGSPRVEFGRLDEFFGQRSGRARPDAWCELVTGLGAPLATKAALAAARVARKAWDETWSDDSSGPHRADPTWAARSVAAALSWARCPCEAHASALRELDALDPAREELAGDGSVSVDTLAWRARKAYKQGLDRGLCAYAAIAGPRAVALPGAPQPFEMAGAVGLRAALSGAAVCAGAPAVLAALEEDLLPLALEVVSSDGDADAKPASGVSRNGVRRVYRLLCDLAWSDGSVAPAERAYLAAFRAKHAIGADEAVALEREARAKEGFKLTKRPDEQALLVTSMVELAAADGVLAPEEKERLRAFGRTLGVDMAAIDDRLRALLASTKKPAARKLESMLSALDPFGGRTLAFPLEGLKVVLTAPVLRELGAAVERLPGRWTIASEERELPQRQPRERRASCAWLPSRWKEHFAKVSPVTELLPGEERTLRATFTMTEDMGSSAWAWGLALTFKLATRELEIEESVDTE